MKRRNLVWSVLLSLAMTACGSTDFSGGAAKQSADSTEGPTKRKKRKPVKDEAASETVVYEDEAEKGDEPVEVSGTDQVVDPASSSTPEAPIDITEEGFHCIDDMSVADGPWAGTFQGNGLSFTPGDSGNFAVTGTVDFDMKFLKKGVMGVTNFNITGGMKGLDQIRSYEPNMELRCGDGSFKPTTVDHAGHKLTVTLEFTHQSWNPPTLKGTWKAKDFLLEWASGTWEVSMK